MRFFPAAVVLALVASPCMASDCSDARNQYGQAISDVSDALSRYTRCVSGSRGQDDCSTEFRRLKYAQSDFESAVSAIGSYCER